jgi:NlpC/P60 family putative phage cell wall peptidase
MSGRETVQAAIVACARTWLGTPYHHMQCVRGAGVDCAQLVRAVMVEAAGLPDFDAGYYPRDWMMHRSDERFLAYVEAHAVEVSAPQPGDVVMYRFGRCYAHASIVTDWPLIIHADSKCGMVAEADGMMGRLKGRPLKLYRLRSLVEGSAS